MHRRFVTAIFIAICLRTLAKAGVIAPTSGSHHLIDCTLEYLKVSESNVFFVYSEETAFEADAAVRRLQHGITIYNLNKGKAPLVTTPSSYHFYWILMKTVDRFPFLLNALYGNAAWNARGLYLVTHLSDSAENVEQIFQEAWSKYVINIAVFHIQNDGSFISTYFPYDGSNCGNPDSVETLGRCGDTLENLFPNKVPLNMHNCSVKISANVYPPFVINISNEYDDAVKTGFEITLVNSVFARLNMSSTITGTPNGFSQRLPNGSYIGIARHVAEKQFDVAAGVAFPNISFFLDIDVSYFYFHNAMTWMVPIAGQGEQWKSLTLIFKKSLWVGLLATFSLNMLTWWVFGNALDDAKQFSGFQWCLLHSWYVLLQGGIKLPRRFALRMLVIAWTVFTLLTAAFYQSQLVSILMNPIKEHQISSSEELAASSVEIIVVQDFLERLAHSNKPSDRIIASRGHLMSLAEHAKVSETFHRNLAFLKNTMSIKYLMRRNYTFPTGEPAMYYFKDVQFWNPVSWFMQKGYPLADRINSLLMRHLENGLLEKWIQDVGFYIPTTVGSDSPMSFTLEQLIGPFFIILIGLTASTVVFLLELSISKFKFSTL